MSILVRFNQSEESLYKRAIELSGTSKLMIKKAYWSDGTLIHDMRALHNDGEEWITIKNFWKVFRMLKENEYIDEEELDIDSEGLFGQFDVNINGEANTFYYSKIEIRSLTFEEKMKNAIIREHKASKLPKKMRIERILAMLDWFIEDSLKDMNKRKFRIYTNAKNRVMRII